MSNAITTENNANVIDLDPIDPMLSLIGSDVDFGPDPVEPAHHTQHANPLSTSSAFANYDATGDFGIAVDSMPIFRATSLA